MLNIIFIKRLTLETSITKYWLRFIFSNLISPAGQSDGDPFYWEEGNHIWSVGNNNIKQFWRFFSNFDSTWAYDINIVFIKMLNLETSMTKYWLRFFFSNLISPAGPSDGDPFNWEEGNHIWNVESNPINQQDFTNFLSCYLYALVSTFVNLFPTLRS